MGKAPRVPAVSTRRAVVGRAQRYGAGSRCRPSPRMTILSPVLPMLTRKSRSTEPRRASNVVVALSTQTGPTLVRGVAPSSRAKAVLGGFWTWARRIWVIKLELLVNS